MTTTEPEVTTAPEALPAGNCEACWHLWSKHGPDGCLGKVFPSHSLQGEPCPCEHGVPDPAREIGRIRAEQLFAASADPDWLGI